MKNYLSGSYVVNLQIYDNNNRNTAKLSNKNYKFEVIKENHCE